MSGFNFYLNFQILCFYFASHFISTSFLFLFLFYLTTVFELELYCIFFLSSQVKTQHFHPFTMWLAFIFSCASSIYILVSHVMQLYIKPLTHSALSRGTPARYYPPSYANFKF